MRSRIFILMAAVALAVFVSGCNGGETKTEVVNTDMLVIEDISAAPSDVVKGGDVVVVRMEVKNAGQKNVYMIVDDDSKKGDVGYDGDMALVNFCEGLYKFEEFKVVSNSKGCDEPAQGYTVEMSGKNIDQNSACYLRFVPGQTHILQWTIKAPTDDELNGLMNECEFNFQTVYAGKAETVTYVYFAAPQEVEQRIYTKDDLTLVGDNVASYGPVVANFETGEAQPISAGIGEGEADNWTVYLNLKNLGSGVAKVKDIKLDVAGDEKIKLSNTFCELGYREDLSEYGVERSYLDSELAPLFEQNRVACNARSDKRNEKCNKDNCDYLIDNEERYDKTMCEFFQSLRNKLEIFQTESSRLSCAFTVPSDFLIMQPFKFVTTAHYAYSQGEDLKIRTEPSP